VGRVGFTLLSAKEAEILFTNFLSEEHGRTIQIYHNGSGVALGDIEGRSALYCNPGN
jgi:hypothetical protein